MNAWHLEFRLAGSDKPRDSTTVGSGPVSSGQTDAADEVASVGFVGRSTELAFLRARLSEVESGLPRTVVIEAPGGTGKSALVQAFLTGLDPADVLRGSGEEGETELAYGVLDQLLGIRSTTLSWPDAFAAGARLLEKVDDHQLTVFVVDDAHLADPESLSALTFALRRLQADRVLTLLATRDADHLPLGLLKLADSEDGRLRLPGLGVDEVADLAADRGHFALPRQAAERLRQHTGGNPLHLRALLDDLTEDDLRGTGPLPAPRSLGQLVLRTLATMNDEVTALAKSAAVFPDGSALALVAQAAGVTSPEGAVDQLTRANLLTCRYADDGWRLSFAHPLVRAAVYDDLGPLDRQRLHRRAADLVDGDASLLHLVAAASGPDPELARLLSERAAGLASNGDARAAATFFLKGASLGEPGPDRDNVLLEAANLYLIAGDIGGARRIGEQLAELPATAQRLYLQARIAWFGGQSTEAEELAEQAWQLGDELEGPGRGSCAAILAQLHNLRGDGAGAAEWADLALAHELTPDLVDTTRAAKAAGLAMTGQPAKALAALAQVPADPGRCGADQEHQLLTRAALRIATDELTGARADLEALISRSTDLAPQRLLARGVLAEVDYRLGRWDDAMTGAEHAISLAEDSEQLWVQGFLHCEVARVAAARGDFASADAHLALARGLAERLEDIATYAICEDVATHVAMCRSDAAAVVNSAQVLAFFRVAPLVEPGWLAWPIHHLAALVDLGRYDEARTTLAAYAETARARGSRSRLSALARVRGELATAERDQGAARAAFEEALAVGEGIVDALERGMALASYGRFLRRRGERRAAQKQLATAREQFLSLGAAPFVARCDEELAASGLSYEPIAPSPLSQLTPQESLVAGLAAEGLTNQEIAHRLVLSVKTVGYHLGNVYAKLDVHSRAQLVTRLSTA